MGRDSGLYLGPGGGTWQDAPPEPASVCKMSRDSSRQADRKVAVRAGHLSWLKSLIIIIIILTYTIFLYGSPSHHAIFVMKLYLNASAV